MIQTEGQRLYCLQHGINYGWECVGLMCDNFWKCKQRQGNDSKEKEEENETDN